MIFYKRKSKLKKERALGAFIGLASGDRIGGPIKMALTLSKCLVESNGFNKEDIARSYLAWWSNGAVDAGQTTRISLELMKTIKIRDDVSFLCDKKLKGKTAGCNPCHRILPLALYRGITNLDLLKLAAEEARITHFHPLAGDTSVSVCVLVRALINGDKWETAKRKAFAGRMVEIKKAMYPQSQKELSNSGYSPNVLAAAIWYVENYNSFDEALDASIIFAGPANYCPVLVGVIGGAKWGVNQIGSFWIKDELRKIIINQVKSLI